MAPGASDNRRTPRRRGGKYRIDRRREAPPVPPTLVQGRAAPVGKPVDAPRPGRLTRPGALNQAGALQAIEGRVDGALGELQHAAAELPQGLDDPVAVGGTGRKDREDQIVKVAAHQLALHVDSLGIDELGMQAQQQDTVAPGPTRCSRSSSAPSSSDTPPTSWGR